MKKIKMILLLITIIPQTILASSNLVSLKPYQKNFIIVEVGNEKSLSFKLSNNSNKVLKNLKFSKIMNSEEISFAHKKCTTIKANSSCIIKVKFSPKKTGHHFESLVIRNKEFKTNLNIVANAIEKKQNRSIASKNSSKYKNYGSSSDYTEYKDDDYQEKDYSIDFEDDYEEDYTIVDNNITEELDLPLENKKEEEITSTNFSGGFISNPNTNTTIESSPPTSNTSNPRKVINLQPDLKTADFILDEDIPKILNLELFDPENDTVSILISQEAQNGSIVINKDNTLVYTPEQNFFGEDYFYIELIDSHGNKNIKKINLTVNSINDAPLAPEVLEYSVKKNENLNFSLLASDIEEDNLTYSFVSRSGNGSLNQLDSENYTYNSNIFYGEEIIEYSVSDGVDTINFSVKIIVENQNLSPYGKNEFYSLENTKTLSVSLFGEDLDTNQSSLIYEIVNMPSLGSLTNNSSSEYTYTPNSNSTTGSDSLSYRVFDGNSYSAIHTVQFSLSQGNRPPIVDIDKNYILDEDQSVAFSLNDIDPDNNLLNYSLVTNSSNGVVSGTYPNFVYTPNQNFNGIDSFSYSVSDGEFTINNTINFTVNPINDQPVIEDIVITMNEEETKSHEIIYNDVEDDNIVLNLNNPNNFPISLTENIITVVAPENFYGKYELTYTINDGNSSVQKNLTVNVININDSPILEGNEFFTNEDTLLSSQLNASDEDNDSLIYSLKSNTSDGSVTVNEDGSFTYMPNTDFNGQDFFTIELSDGTSIVEENITINVTSINDIPVSEDIIITMDEDSTHTHTIISNDKDGDEIYYSLNNPNNYPVSLINGQIIVTPPSDFNGAYNLSYTTNDGKESVTNQINVTVNAVNDVPVLVDSLYTTNEDTPLLNQVLNITDKDGDVITVSLINTSSNGVLSLNNLNFDYTPNQNFTGTDSFLIRISDGLSSIDELIKINVLAINDAPEIEDIIINMDEDSIRDYIISVNDIEGDSVALSLNNPENFPIILSNTTLEIRPPSNFNGTYNLSYTANDGEISVSKNITININPINDAPELNETIFITNEDTILYDQLSVSDIDSNSHSYNLIDSTNNGVLNLNTDGSFSYSPNENFNGQDQFTVSISDGEETITEIITINVLEINDSPNLISDMVKDVYVDQNYNWSIKDHFQDIDSTNHTYSIDRNPNQGFMEINNEGIINFQSPSLIPNSYTETLVISVSDGEFIQNINLTLNYQKENIKPSGENRDLTIYINQDYPFSLSGLDANGDTLSFILNNNTPIVSSFNSSTGEMILNSDQLGTFSFQYKVSDGDLESENYNVNVTVVYEDGSGLRASYYQGVNFQEKISQRIDSQVDFNWGGSTEPVNGIGSDYYSVKWEGYIYFDEIGDYNLRLSGDDGIKLYIEENLIIDAWQTQAYKSFNSTFNISQLGKKKVTILYFEQTGQSRVNFSWKKPSQSSFATVPEKYLFPKDLESSDYMFEITINKDLILDNLYDFPVLFKLEMLDNSSFWTHVQANGYDIRVYDKDQKAIPFELLNFDNVAKTGNIWFKSDLTNGIDNKFYIGVNDKSKEDKEKISITDDLYRNNVWSAYHLVLHYEENNVLLNSVNDELVNLVGSQLETNNSLLGQSFYFDSFSHIEFSTTFGNVDISLESWIKPDYLNTDNLSIFGKENSYGVMGISTNENDINFFRQAGSGSIEMSTIDTMSLSKNEWNFFSAGIESNNLSAKINMEELNEDPITEILNSGSGITSIAKSVFSNQINFQGSMDETRISKTKLSDEWSRTQYNMMTQLNIWWKKDQLMSSENFTNMDISSLNSSWSTYEGSNYNLQSTPEGIAFNSINHSYGPGMVKEIDISSNIFQIEFDLFGDSGSNENYFAFFIKLGNNLSSSQQNAAITTLWGTESFGLDTRNGFGYISQDNNAVNQVGSIVQEVKKIKIVVNKLTGKYNLYLNNNMVLDIDFDKNIEINTLMFNSSQIDSRNDITVKIQNLTISEL